MKIFYCLGIYYCIHAFCGITLVAHPQTALCDIEDKAKQLTYKGNIGNQLSVTLQLEFTNTSCTGRYHYHKYRQDILLKGELIDDKWIIKEMNSKGEEKNQYFKGTFSADQDHFLGTWENPVKGITHPSKFECLKNPLNSSTTIDYEKTRKFQELLNYFDLQVMLPCKIDRGIDDMHFKWTPDTKTYITDFKQNIPYHLARNYIMDQVNIKVNSPFDYFDMDESFYNNYNAEYKSIGKIFSNNKSIGLLFHFDEDTGWDEYELFFLLVFDHEGNLLANIKTYTYVITEGTGKISSEKSWANLTNNGSITVISESIVIEYGNDAQTGEEYYNENNKNQTLEYTVTANGLLDVKD
ncbi:MAG: hypothetical protein MK212_17645 [Saprospiraceae bacterium]|nr:hypothetical protein [Saprospiraceae bacterium]